MDGEKIFNVLLEATPLNLKIWRASAASEVISLNMGAERVVGDTTANNLVSPVIPYWSYTWTAARRDARSGRGRRQMTSLECHIDSDI